MKINAHGLTISTNHRRSTLVQWRNRLNRKEAVGASVGSGVLCGKRGVSVEVIGTVTAPPPDDVLLNERQDPAVLFQAQPAKGDVAAPHRNRTEGELPRQCLIGHHAKGEAFEVNPWSGLENQQVGGGGFGYHGVDVTKRQTPHADVDEVTENFRLRHERNDDGLCGGKTLMLALFQRLIGRFQRLVLPDIVNIFNKPNAYDTI
jgi:hypothetical protein